MSIKRMVKKIIDGAETLSDYILDDTVLTVGRFVFSMFTLSATAFYAITNTLPIIPQWAWAGIFVFMLIVGTYDAQDLIYLGVDEPDEEPEDDEVWDDGDE